MQAEGRRFDPDRLHHPEPYSLGPLWAIFGSPGFIDIVKRDEIDPEMIVRFAQAGRDQDLDLSKSRMLTVIIRVGRKPVGWSLGNE